MHASIDTTFWKRQTIGLETISGSQAEGVTTKGQNEGVSGDKGTVLCLTLVVKFHNSMYLSKLIEQK